MTNIRHIFIPNLHRLFCMLLAWPILIGATLAGESIVNSPHDLSVNGPGGIKAVSESEVCIFCHTPHGASAQAPLWNRYDAPGTYTPYSSSTVKATIGQPTGASKLCLSCHDGTVALGMVRSRSSVIPLTGGVIHMPDGPAKLGKDLSDDHPISFTYDTSLAQTQGELRPPSTLPPHIRLDANNQMQCTACHDPHDNQFGKFMVMGTTGGALCLECHQPDGWNSSVHALSTATWNGSGVNPWPQSEETTVQANACANCHRSHGAGHPEQLLTFAFDEDNCLTCHNGNVAQTNLDQEFRKISTHDIFAFRGIHDPAEDITTNPQHVTCADCHNPHAMRAGGAAAGELSGTLINVPGVSAAGTPVAVIQQESELCYRCHADFQNPAQALISRQFPESNVRREFLSTNASYHPVEAVGANPDVPSLFGTWSEASRMTCTDCHNNDDGPGAGGTGPRGPHGSTFAPLLERRLELEDGFGENGNVYALCYKCHNRTSIMNESNSKIHKKHIDDAKTSCITCHDPHGVENATNLINFNRERVTPFNGVIAYIDNGTPDASACTLTCHGEDHNNKSFENDLLQLPLLPQ